MKKYRCIKEFNVSKYDEDDCHTNEYVSKSDIRMYLESGDDDLGYIDITYETFKECFERIA